MPKTDGRALVARAGGAGLLAATARGVGRALGGRQPAIGQAVR